MGEIILENQASTKVSYIEFAENLRASRMLCETEPLKWLVEKETGNGFKAKYMTWTKVWLWVAKKYDNDFEFTVLEVGEEHVLANLRVKNSKATLGLKLETFVNKRTGKTHKETIEQVQMRIFVKLVANITGFGLNLWMK